MTDIDKFIDNIITGDAKTVLKEIPDNSIHLIITSPPYNVGKNYDSHNDKMEYKNYCDWLCGIWKEVSRILAPGGRFCLNIAPTGIKEFIPLHHDLTQDIRKIGLKFRTEIIWYKQTMLKRTAWGSWKSPANPHIIPSWEYILVFTKNGDNLQGNYNDIDITAEEFKEYTDGIWRIQPETKRNGHPAPFPEALIYRLIKFYSYRGNIVLDMFGGTGTVALVATMNKRHFIHIDISEEYNSIAKQRLSNVYYPKLSNSIVNYLASPKPQKKI